MANYNVDISVAIKNTNKLTSFNKQLDKTAETARRARQGLSEIGQTVKSNLASLSNLSAALSKAQKEFNNTVLGTKASVLAARDLASAERMVNKELKERTALMNKFRFQGGGSAFKSFSQRADQITSPNVLTVAQQKAIDRNNRKRGITATPFGAQPMVNQPFEAVSLTSPQAIRDRIINRRATNFARTGTASSFPRSEGFLAFSKSADKIAAGVKQNVIHTKKTASILTQQATRAAFEGMPFGVKGGQIGAAPPPTFFNKMGFGKNANAGGMFAMPGGAMGRLKGGAGSAMIGGGFPFLFGAGGLSAAMGGVAGGIGGALAPGGGFALSIAATAAAAQIEKARAFRKEINNLNLELESMGINSTFSRKQIKELAKEFKITNDEAIKLATTFKTFGAGQADVLLSAFGSREVFDTLSGLRTTEAVLGKIEGIREEISETQRQDLLQTLATKGSLETQAKLERIIFEQRKKAFVEGEIDKIKILDIPKEFRATEALQKEFANMKRIALGSEFENTNSSALKLLETQIKINEQMQFLSEFNAPAEEIRELLNPMRAVLDLSMSIRTGFEESFKGIIKGTMSVQDAFRNMLGRIADHFLDTAARLAAAQLQRGFLGLFSNLFSFGMSSNPLGMRQQGVGASANMLNRHAVGSSAVQPVLKFANGGRPPVGKPSIVGERGAELFVPDRAGTIIPNHAMGGTNIVVNVDASGSNVEGDEDEGRALGIALSAAIETELIKQKRPGGLLA